MSAASGSQSARLAARVGLGGLGVLALAAVWSGLAKLMGEDQMSRNFTPRAVAIATADLLGHTRLWPHVAVSLQRVTIGLGVALMLAVPFGLLVGTSRRFDALTSPSIQFLRMISPISWMPLAVMVFGIGDRPVWFLLSFAAIWPILLNTAAGVRQLRPSWLDLGKSLAATRREMLLHVVLPGIVPNVLTGIRLAIGISWIVLVPAEMLGVNAGLGYYILDARDRLAYSELMAIVLVVGALGFLLDLAVRELARHFG